MLKNALVTTIVATTVALLSPFATTHIGSLSVRVGIILIELGLFIDRPTAREQEWDAPGDGMPHIERVRAIEARS